MRCRQAYEAGNHGHSMQQLRLLQEALQQLDGMELSEQQAGDAERLRTYARAHTQVLLGALRKHPQ